MKNSELETQIENLRDELLFKLNSHTGKLGFYLDTEDLSMEFKKTLSNFIAGKDDVTEDEDEEDDWTCLCECEVCDNGECNKQEGCCHP